MLLAICVSILVISCESKPPKSKQLIDQIDSISWIWKHDRFGCKGKRIEICQDQEKFYHLKRSVEGSSADSIRAFLGKPDRADVYDSLVKYTYFVEPTVHCRFPEREWVNMLGKSYDFQIVINIGPDSLSYSFDTFIR